MSASPQFPKLPTGWIEETEKIGPLFYREFRRTAQGMQQRPLRRLYLVHGFGEQSDRFQHFPHYLQTSVDAIALIDLPGHGQSAGARGFLPHFDFVSEAVLTGFRHFVHRTDAWMPQAQTHWMGASMGGLTTLRTLFRHSDLPLRSVIVTEAQLGIAVPVPWLKEFFGELVAPVLGRLPLANEIAAEVLSHDPSVQAEYTRNPLNHDRVTPRTFVEMKKEMAELNQRAERHETFPYPLLMLVPLADQVVSWQKEMSFFAGVQVPAVTKKHLVTFPGFRHEAFNEIGKERPFTALEEWLRSFA